MAAHFCFALVDPQLESYLKPGTPRNPGHLAPITKCPGFGGTTVVIFYLENELDFLKKKYGFSRKVLYFLKN